MKKKKNEHFYLWNNQQWQQQNTISFQPFRNIVMWNNFIFLSVIDYVLFILRWDFIFFLKLETDKVILSCNITHMGYEVEKKLIYVAYKTTKYGIDTLTRC